MKKYLKNYLTWIFVWLGFLSVLFLWYLAIKARQSTNPGIADDWQGMYATNGTTLTAGKWNTLVQRSTWVDVPTTDTANFDINCERRAKVLWWACSISGLWTPDFVWATAAAVWRHDGMRQIDNTNKTKIYRTTNPVPTAYCSISLMQKRCQ